MDGKKDPERQTDDLDVKTNTGLEGQWKREAAETKVAEVDYTWFHDARLQESFPVEQFLESNPMIQKL